MVGPFFLGVTMKRILLVIAFIPACGIGNLPTSKHHVDFKPLASDPEQNFDSNCWLVAALSAWADKNPKSVQDSIGVDTNGDWVIYGRNRETGHVKRTELPPNPLNKDDVYNPLSKAGFRLTDSKRAASNLTLISVK